MSPLTLAAAFVDAFNRRDADTMEAMLGPETVYVASGRVVAQGRQQIRQFYAAFFDTDVTAAIRDAVEDDELAFFEVELVGTLPDRSGYRLTSAVRQRWSNGLMVDDRSYPDPPVVDDRPITFDEFTRRAAAASEPNNAAAVSAREVFAGLADLEFVDRVLPTKLAPGYLREDRRRLVAVPPEIDAAGLTEGIRVWHQMSDGAPRFGTKRIVAVRGERLAIAHHEIVLGDGSSTEFLLLVQLDDECDLTERVIQFDVDAEATAVATLDELAAALGTADRGGRT